MNIQSPTAERTGSAEKAGGEIPVIARHEKPQPSTDTTGNFAISAISTTERTRRPEGAHGFGISYAGELPQIALPQVIQLTEFHNRPA